jgi:hypothetical protein
LFVVVRLAGIVTALAPPISKADEPAAGSPPGSQPAVSGSTAGDHQDLILIVGAPGTEEYRATFETWASRWQDAAVRGRVACHRIPGPAVSPDGAAADSSATRDALEAVVREQAARSGSEPLWIVFLGHGTFDGRAARWNLPGRDVAAGELAGWLADQQRPVIVIACASCSSPFINELAAPWRIVVAATKDGQQVQYSRFGEFLSQAISGLDGDIDRDGQTSLLEAWLFAARRTAGFYETEGRLATEHSLLDDNHDGKGTRMEVFTGDKPAANVTSDQPLDGEAARRWHFVRSPEEQQLTPDQRVLRTALESRIELLKQKKSTLSEADYLAELEELLLPLSRLYAEAALNPELEPSPATPPATSDATRGQ